jgi:hypothetical protein
MRDPTPVPTAVSTRYRSIQHPPDLGKAFDVQFQAVAQRLDAFQTLLYDRALARQEAKEIHVDSWDDFTDLFKDNESSFV